MPKNRLQENASDGYKGSEKESANHSINERSASIEGTKPFYEYLYQAFKAIAEQNLNALDDILAKIPLPDRQAFIMMTSWSQISNDIKNAANHEQNMAVTEQYIAPKERATLLNYGKALQDTVKKEIKESTKPTKNEEEAPSKFIERWQQWSKQVVETPYDPLVTLLQQTLREVASQKQEQRASPKSQKKKRKKTKNKYYDALMAGDIEKVKRHMRAKKNYCSGRILKNHPYTALYITLNRNYPVKNPWAMANLLVDNMKPHELTYVCAGETYLKLANDLLEVSDQTQQFYEEGNAFVNRLTTVLKQCGNHLYNQQSVNNHKDELQQDEGNIEDNPLFFLVGWANEERAQIKGMTAVAKKTEAEKTYAKNLRKKLNVLLAEQPNITDFINQTNCHGETPLHLAAKHGHHAIVAFLLPYGAQLATTYGMGHPLLIQDSKGYTPAQLAENNGHGTLARWLYLYEAYYNRREAAEENGFCTLSSSLGKKMWEPKYKNKVITQLFSNNGAGDSVSKNRISYSNLFVKRLELAILLFLSITLPTSFLLGLIAGPLVTALAFYVLFHVVPLAAFIPIVMVTSLPLLITSTLAVPTLSLFFIAQVAVVLATLEAAVEISLRFSYDVCVNRVGRFLLNKIKSPLPSLRERSMIKQLDEELRDSVYNDLYAEISNEMQKDIAVASHPNSKQSLFIYEKTVEKLFWKDDKERPHTFIQTFRGLKKDEMCRETLVSSSF